MKRQTTQWKKMFATHTTDKDLVSKMYKELIQINQKNRQKLEEALHRERNPNVQ